MISSCTIIETLELAAVRFVSALPFVSGVVDPDGAIRE
jgi:hypothetical protein